MDGELVCGGGWRQVNFFYYDSKYNFFFWEGWVGWGRWRGRAVRGEATVSDFLLKIQI